MRVIDIIADIVGPKGADRWLNRLNGERPRQWLIYGSPDFSQLAAEESLRELFEERAAIMQYEGALPREEAERAALKRVLMLRTLH